MARIRSIKPEFWSSPGLPPDPWERLLYMAMWNWADDNGVGTANPRELLGFAFPNDENITVEDLRRMLVGIRRAFGVVFYTVANRPYYSIPSWEKHQKFDRRSKGKYPGPDQAETYLYDDAPPVDQREPVEPRSNFEDSTDTRGNSTSPRRDSVAGTGEQGNRGTGETPQPPAADERAAIVPIKPPRGGREVAERLNATAHSPEAHTIARGYQADYTRRTGNPIAGDLLSGIARRVDECLASGISPEQIVAGLRAWEQSKMTSVTQISSFVHKAGARPASAPAGVGKPTTKAQSIVAAGEALIEQMRAQR